MTYAIAILVLVALLGSAASVAYSLHLVSWLRGLDHCCAGREIYAESRGRHYRVPRPLLELYRDLDSDEFRPVSQPPKRPRSIPGWRLAVAVVPLCERTLVALKLQP